MLVKNIMYSLSFLVFFSCKKEKVVIKQDTIKPHTILKTFDIATFNKNKDHLKEYNFITKDSTVIYQNVGHDGYFELIKPKESYFQTRNKYFLNGNLKSTVEDFPNDFLAGIKKEYDKKGNLVKETNYDEPYKFTFKDILKFIKERKIDMNSPQFEITRGIDENNLFWGITWEKEDKSTLIHIGIDGITGKIVQEIDMDYPQKD